MHIFPSLLSPVLLAVVATLSTAPAATQVGGTPKPAAPRLLVPAYFYPAGDGATQWKRLLASASKAPIVAVVNPASGPGKKSDSNYLNIFAQAKKTKITLIGYVWTSYGKRSLKDVQADVDQWKRLYPGVAGIFFDEQASGEDLVDYYTALRKYVRETKRMSLVVTNPGTVCSAKYLAKPATDVACLFEGARAFDPSSLPDWVSKYLPDHVAVLSYNVATARDMQASIGAAVKKKIGYLYITDGCGANPWAALPKYWEAEVEAVGNPRKE